MNTVLEVPNPSETPTPPQPDPAPPTPTPEPAPPAPIDPPTPEEAPPAPQMSEQDGPSSPPRDTPERNAFDGQDRQEESDQQGEVQESGDQPADEPGGASDD